MSDGWIDPDEVLLQRAQHRRRGADALLAAVARMAPPRAFAIAARVATEAHDAAPSIRARQLRLAQQIESCAEAACAA